MSLTGIDITETIHRSVQYLAAAGINYLDAKKDDSHTNLSWDSETNTFLSRNLNGNKLYLGLNLSNFRLEFLRNNIVLASKPVAGSSHPEIMEWLGEVFRDLGFPMPFLYRIHFELPYSPMGRDYVYEDIDKESLTYEANLRKRAHSILNYVKSDFQDSSEVRTWPHHFDTSAKIDLGGEHSIIVGMAIPDNLSEVHYFYVSAWNGIDMKDVSEFPELKNGSWISDEWKGGIINCNASDAEIIEFFKEAFEYYK